MQCYIDTSITSKDFAGNLMNYFEFHDNVDVTNIVTKSYILVPQRPSHFHEWVSGNWVENMVNRLTEAKGLKKGELDYWIDNLSKGSITFNGIKFNAGFDAVKNLSTVLAASEISGYSTLDVFDYTNAPHTFTVVEVRALIKATNDDYQTKLKLKQDISVKIDSAKTVDEVNIITIPTIS